MRARKSGEEIEPRGMDKDTMIDKIGALGLSHVLKPSKTNIDNSQKIRNFSFFIYGKDEELKENEDSNNQLDENSIEDNDPPAENPKPSKAKKNEKPVRKPPARGKAKKTPAVKKELLAIKKSKSSADDVIADIAAVTEDLHKETEEQNTVVEDSKEEAAEEEQPKPAKRGRKRKTEEKENEPSQDSADEPASNVEEPPEKKSTSTKGSKSAPEKPIKPKPLPTDGIIDNHNLPKGWMRKTVVRKTGKSAGQIDIYIYSPDGYKFRSKPEIVNFLNRTNSNLKIEHFDFSKKNVLENNETVKAALTGKTLKKKSAPVKSKPPVAKKKEAASAKKGTKFVVKIVSEKKKKTMKKSTEKAAKTSKAPIKKKKTTVKVATKDSKKKKA
ncbi:Methyl-CpG-binding domain protein 2 like protein [Argiope bruennichi]|uniref:Methyl-CpG-binding domain protein 2 like protein n=1 Tax=Argiope bruennichi TaxID=94029 RepID=A0A8T0EBL5_ARGBR|nr:Methyl-CpG-binding domain protein 2 like protein [Argiope bruennichi]